MPYSVSIISGKGGTGKTTVSVSLYRMLTRHRDVHVHLADCDVEEPNDLLFFPEFKTVKGEQVNKLVPVIDKDNCTYCRKCAEYCEFNAIVVIPPAEYASVNNDLCHACGACLEACEFNAITEHPEPIGTVNFIAGRNGVGITEGRLKIGSTMQTMMIRETKKRITEDHDIIILDAPPGTSCPVVETVAGTDFVIIVAEPTPFGLHDMMRIVELLEEIGIPFGVVINKAGMGDRKIYGYIGQKKIKTISEIPYDRNFAAAIARGRPEEGISIEIEEQLEKIAEDVLGRYNLSKG